MMKHFLSLILTILLVLTVLFAQVSSVGNSNNANKLSVTYITGTDALGRKIKPVADFRKTGLWESSTLPGITQTSIKCLM